MAIEQPHEYWPKSALSLELHEQTMAAIKRGQMLGEAERIRRVPGIVFVDGAAGRRARVAGTGLDVFEIVKTLREVDGDLSRLHEAYSWLSEAQLQAALTYTKEYPVEIEQRLDLEERLASSDALLPR